MTYHYTKILCTVRPKEPWQIFFYEERFIIYSNRWATRRETMRGRREMERRTKRCTKKEAQIEVKFRSAERNVRRMETQGRMKREIKLLHVSLSKNKWIQTPAKWSNTDPTFRQKLFGLSWIFNVGSFCHIELFLKHKPLRLQSIATVENKNETQTVSLTSGIPISNPLFICCCGCWLVERVHGNIKASWRNGLS